MFLPIISVVAFTVVDHEFETRSAQTKEYKISICCFCTKRSTLRAKTGWIGTRRMCRIAMTCFSELALYTNPSKCVGVVESGHHAIEM